VTIDGPPSLGARLSKWLAIQVFVSFVVVSLIVFMVISSYLSARQVEGLEERRVQVAHMFEEADSDDAVAELWHYSLRATTNSRKPSTKPVRS